MDLSSYLTGDVARIRVVSWSFLGTEEHVVDEVTLEIEDVHGGVRLDVIKFAPRQGLSVDSLQAFVRVLNGRLSG